MSRLPEIDNSYITEGGVDSSDFDQYLSSESNGQFSGYQQSYSKDDDETNNNHKNKRFCADTVSTQHSGDGFEETVHQSYARYHELQPSNGVKADRFLTSTSPVYSYQSSYLRRHIIATLSICSLTNTFSSDKSSATMA
ncbi:hypothetical protein WA026_020592 [Henosepilachna vigintioctopunctata]|uniref:Uncharacterized protein n=1 Tax=Henosepilachna vigintioctopunctata TaxID=420089 RepID=A0AAW1V129_9CUCU